MPPHAHSRAERKRERMELGHQRMVLRGADREAFLRAVANPPAPSARLIAALRRHGGLKR